MTKLRKHFWLAFLCMALIGVPGPRAVYAADTDITALSGQGATNNIDVWRIDSNYTMHLATSAAHDSFNVYGSSGAVDIWSGDIRLKGGLATPSTTEGTYPAVKVQFLNGSGAATAQG